MTRERYVVWNEIRERYVRESQSKRSLGFEWHRSEISTFLTPGPKIVANTSKWLPAEPLDVVLWKNGIYRLIPIVDLSER